tara:strand:+ start:307 stop:1167 length:861 start_codon:yes stop_codon:yes gene_type:complete
VTTNFDHLTPKKEGATLNIQDTLTLDVPNDLSDIADCYNEEWDSDSGQAHEIKNFIELTKDRNCLLDIGGNIGFMSLTFLINNNDDAKKYSYCIEPSKVGVHTLGRILVHNDKDDRLDNVYVYEVFMGEKQKQCEFLIERGSNTLSVTYERKDDPRFKIETNGADPSYSEMSTVDDFYRYLINKQRPLPDTIKIDVEGYDYRVLLGGEKYLMIARPLMFLEVHRDLLNMYNDVAQNIWDFLIERNYNLYTLQKNKIENLDEYVSLFNNTSELRLVCSPTEGKSPWQ